MPTPHRQRMVEAGYAPAHHSEKKKKAPEPKKPEPKKEPKK